MQPMKLSKAYKFWRADTIPSSSSVGSSSMLKSPQKRSERCIVDSKSKNSQKNDQISTSAQAIITFCMENARSDIIMRILKRMAFKRSDFCTFFKSLHANQLAELANSLKSFITDVVKEVNNSQRISEISIEFGMYFVMKRNWGFKADYFSLMADALITEFVFLDGAIHQSTETIAAWASLAELTFGHVRDGYYRGLREMRKNNSCSFNSLSANFAQSCSFENPTHGAGKQCILLRRGRSSSAQQKVNSQSSLTCVTPIDNMTSFSICRAPTSRYNSVE